MNMLRGSFDLSKSLSPGDTSDLLFRAFWIRILNSASLIQLLRVWYTWSECDNCLNHFKIMKTRRFSVIVVLLFSFEKKFEFLIISTNSFTSILQTRFMMRSTLAFISSRSYKCLSYNFSADLRRLIFLLSFSIFVQSYWLISWSLVKVSSSAVISEEYRLMYMTSSNSRLDCLLFSILLMRWLYSCLK